LTTRGALRKIVAMKNSQISLIVILVTALVSTVSFAQGTSPSPNAPSIPSDSPAMTSPSGSPSSPTGQASAEDMQKMMTQMMELGKPGENHKLLADLAGNWTYTIKMWMNPDPNAKPEESKGTAVRKSMFDGRFFLMDVTGKMEMPQPDGKKKQMTFKGMGIDGYDNVKKKFVSSWIDSMGTGIMLSEGDYDPATKTFTYTSEYEAIPGMKQKIREVIKIVDKDHHTFEWYEDRGGQEVKTMEIAYTRKK
jgi:hypothetical protein